MSARNLILSVFLFVFYSSASESSGQEVLIDRTPDMSGHAIRDMEMPDFPDFNLFVVASVSFDEDVNVTSITTYYTNGSNLWPHEEFAEARLCIFEAPLESDDDPEQAPYVVAFYSLLGEDLISVTAEMSQLSEPVILKGGKEYWIGLTPYLAWSVHSSEFRWGSEFGPESWIRNPSGSFTFGPEWVEVEDVIGDPLSASITIEGHELVTSDVQPNSFNVFRGIYLSGRLQDTFASDDLYLKYRPGITLFPTEPPVWLVFETTLPIDNPLSLGVTLEASSNTVNLMQTIEMFNWNSGQFETVDTTELAGFDSDAVYSINVSGDVANYVQSGSGAVRSRFGWRAAGPVFVYPWIISIDQVEWSFGAPDG